MAANKIMILSIAHMNCMFGLPFKKARTYGSDQSQRGVSITNIAISWHIDLSKAFSNDMWECRRCLRRLLFTPVTAY